MRSAILLTKLDKSAMRFSDCTEICYIVEEADNCLLTTLLPNRAVVIEENGLSVQYSFSLPLRLKGHSRHAIFPYFHITLISFHRPTSYSASPLLLDEKSIRG